MVALFSANYTVDYKTYQSINQHIVVVYGYKNDTYIAHFGWPDDINSYKEVFISDVTFNGMFSIEYMGDHVHSNNLPWSNDTHSGTFCPCGYVSCNHQLTSWYTDDVKHYQDCIWCNYTYECLHQYNSYEEVLICVTCGYITDNCIHNFVYNNSYSAMTHNLICNMCGTEKEEYHILTFLKGRYYCSKCPFVGGSETIVPTPNPLSRREEDEEN